LVQRFAVFRSQRAAKVVEVFCCALKSEDVEVVRTAIAGLLAFRPPSLPMSCDVLLAGLGRDAVRPRLLRLLALSRPASVNIALIGWFVGFTPAEKWQHLVLLSLCRHADVASLLVQTPDAWLLAQTLPSHVQLQMLLCLLQQSGYRSALMNSPQLPQLLIVLIGERDLDILRVIPFIIGVLPMDAAFVLRLSQAGVVILYLTVIAELNFEQLFPFGYQLIEKVSRVGWVDDLALFITVAVQHIDRVPGLMMHAVAYLFMVSLVPRPARQLPNWRVGEFLLKKRPVLPPDVVEWVDRILLNMKANGAA
jgi:hypothetical protein